MAKDQKGKLYYLAPKFTFYLQKWKKIAHLLPLDQRYLKNKNSISFFNYVKIWRDRLVINKLLIHKILIEDSLKKT